MRDDERIWAVRKLLDEYVRSPSLRHVRDPESIARLSRDIVNRLDGGNSIWRKWDAKREALVRSALPCWIPIEDMQGFLNRMPGPQLTRVDVEQRLRAFEEEEYFEHRNQAFEKGCLTIYRREKAKGTELTAIVGLLRDYVQELEDRTRVEERERYREIQNQKRLRRGQLLASGADCNWSQIEGFPNWHCRKNGRTYRLSPSKNGKWTLQEVSGVQDTHVGFPLGIYSSRREATKAIRTLAYA
ncbi:hypothetical protein [Hyphomicrobium sp.]|uniref:hypothetical protein n=1 Tax=Hyphomicrobium sp. TaxID=82 RepID=UPI002E33E208|nr:hypothetical protein [Hyphomicrobium sp.]HEX2839972.1 hypothetical protein [Hyphomicrobium sp.]